MISLNRMVRRDHINRRRFLVASAATLAAPCAARAQQTERQHLVAILHPAVPVAGMSVTGPSIFRAFFEELRRLGYVEGKNLAVARRSAASDERRLPALARELAELKPAVIFAITNRAVAAVRAATTTIPIVAFVADPVVYGFAANLARPGGIITGFSVDPGLEFFGKVIALRKEAVPTAARIALLNPRGGTRAKPAGLSRGGPATENRVGRRVLESAGQ